MVAGLLKWIEQTNRSAYFTRRGLIARTANYLKAVGHNIWVIKSWDGTSPRHTSEYKGVILVLGGSQETNYLMVDPSEITKSTIKQHYSYQTVGSILYHRVAPM
jgi:hypothetical protein